MVLITSFSRVGGTKPQVTCLYSHITLVSRLGCRHAS